MRLVGKIFWGSISTLLVSSCFDPPEFPLVPDIGFESIRFVDMPDPSPSEVVTDSLVLQLSFRDGDGDLGIDSRETGPPFNDRWYYTKENLSPNCDDNPTDGVKRCFQLRLEDIQKYVNYKLKRVPQNGSDTLKAFVKPYNCTNWEVVRDGAGKVIDTVYFQLNPHYNNITVEFQLKESPSSCSSPPCFSVFDWSQYLTYPSCEVQGFNGRFPYLNTEDLGETPLAGVIKYSMPSPFFKTIFGARTLRLRVYIEDRSLNRSNEIITPEFTLRP